MIAISGASASVSRRPRSLMSLTPSARRAGGGPLVPPEDVQGSEDDAEGRHDAGHRIAGEGADQHEELADEARQPWQREAGEAGDQERAGQQRGDRWMPP